MAKFLLLAFRNVFRNRRRTLMTLLMVGGGVAGLLLVGGFFRSLQFTSLNTIAYADLDHRQLSRATSLVAVGQQLSISVGVAIGALVVDITLRQRGHAAITAADFQPAFVAVAAIAGCACLVFRRMPADAGGALGAKGD